MNYEDLTPDMMDKARACKTPEELLQLAKESGYELSDKELEQISGGWDDPDAYRDYCSSRFCTVDKCGSFYCNMVSCDPLDCHPYGYGEKY